MTIDQPDASSQIAGLIFAVMLIDADNKVVEANQAAENLLGKSAKRLVGMPIGEAVFLHDDRVNSRLQGQDAALVARHVRLEAGGKDQKVNLTLSPVNSHPGWRVVTLSEVGRDDATQDDQSTDAALGAPSILAHEIKNPLAAIRGAAQLVERKLPDENKSLAKMIRDEVDRIAGLIDRMQRLGSTKQEPVEPCNLHEAIRTAIGTVRAGDGAKVEIKEEFDPSIPPVLVNRASLEQVLINLISNARDACQDCDEPLIIVRTRFVSGLAFSAIRLGRAVRLPIQVSISDNGPGIDDKIGDHIFEPFVTSKKSGQGLGLALVRKLVGDMEGRISHERDKRAGVTYFRLHLPNAPQDDNG